MRGTFNTIGFLESYRDATVLWDRNHPDYKNRQARQDAETKLMEAYEFDTAQEVRHKIRILRNTYNLELSRINASIKNGADADSVYRPKLAWFALADSFLGKNVDDNTSWVEMENGHEYDMTTSGGKRTMTIKTEHPREKKKAKRKEDKKKKHLANYDLAGSSYQSAEELMGANEFVVFGQHVAIQLEKLPLETSLRLQSEIQTMLTKARLESMREGYRGEYARENDPISEEEE